MILVGEHPAMNREIWEIRRDNLQALINIFPGAPGNRSAFCRKYGFDHLQIGQYFTASKNARRMGERKAREIESKIGTIRQGWLDDEHDMVTADVLQEAAPDAVANEFLMKIKGLQREYDTMKPDEKQRVDEMDPKLKKFLKPE